MAMEIQFRLVLVVRFLLVGKDPYMTAVAHGFLVIMKVQALSRLVKNT